MTRAGSTKKTRNHRELADILSKDIENGEYLVGQKFPTEFELQARFGVGRHTVREALKILAEYGLIGRRRKTGTTVLAKKPVSQYVHSLRNIKDLLDFATNTELDIRHIGYIRVQQTAEFAGTGDGRLLRIAGIRTSRNSGQPICWAEIFVPEEFAKSKDDIRTEVTPIYDHIVKKHALKLAYVEQAVSATELESGIAALLNAESETAGLMVMRRYVDDTGRVFEVSRNLYPGNRYSLRTVFRQRA